MSYRRLVHAIAIQGVLTAMTPWAADIVLTPPAGGGVTVTNAVGDTARFRVGEDGITTLPGLTAVPVPSTGLCVEIATGRVGTCALPAGTVTSITAGSGLTGGTITGSGTLGLAATSLLPTTACAVDQYPKWSGSAWVCASLVSGGLADGSVTTAKLADGAVTTAKLFDSGVTTAKLNAFSVTTAKLSDAAVTLQKLNTSGPCSGGMVLRSDGFNLTCMTPGNLGFLDNIALPMSTNAVGNITKGPLPFIHNNGVDTTFLGVNAGNYSLTGADNVGIGVQSSQTLSTGGQNTGVGSRSLQLNSTGNNNTGVGAYALQNTTSGFNTALGARVLQANVSGTSNTGVGNLALWNNTSSDNTAVGAYSLQANTSGNSNTAAGVSGLTANTSGHSNVAVGRSALAANTTGVRNTAIGRDAIPSGSASDNTAIGAYTLAANTTGTFNAALGVDALHFNTTGSENAASGYRALYSNTIGNRNSASGEAALYSTTTGDNNTASGNQALYFNTAGNNNTALGKDALYFSTGNFNIGIGRDGGYNLTSGSYNIAIGHAGVAAEGATIRIGTPLQQTRAFIAGIRGATTGVGDAITVMVDSSGQLGTVSSSARAKDAIADMGDVTAALMKLRPVTFRYTEHGAASRLQYGLVAEEVEQIYPGLVAKKSDGSAETVMYHFLPPMLLNEYQRQQRLIDGQARQIAELERDRQLQGAAVSRQAAEIAGLKAAVAEVADLKRQMAHMARTLARIDPDARVNTAAR